MISEIEIVHVQSVLQKTVVQSLKQKAGTSAIKEAISRAVYHYINCDEAEPVDEKTRKS
jgi:hypothetical protein